MAKLYSQERSKYGNLTGQIIIWPVEINPDINSSSNRENLPSGYLRCDGTIYNVNDYPQLAAVCGVGTNGKFVRRNIGGTALQSLTDNQFVVPDLGSKYPLPTPGADAGIYKNIRETNTLGNEVNRSGIGIEATSTLGTTISVTYSGTFTVPSQAIELKGKPSWTWGTTAGKRTESEVVDSTSIAGHMHFGSIRRTRVKSTNEIDVSSPNTQKDPQAAGLVAYWNASTIPIQQWMDNTVATGTSGSPPAFPGNNQPACRAFASNEYAKSYQFYWGAFAGTWDPTAYSGGCYNSGNTLSTSDWRTKCLLNANWNNFPISQTNYEISPGVKPRSVSGLNPPLLPCFIDDQDDITVSKSVTATYTATSAGVPVDWKSATLHDVVPFNSNLNTDSSRIYADLFNEITETTDLVQATDPTSHYHKVDLDRGTHSFKYVTDALELSPDNLKTTLNLSVDNAVSVDSVVSPFIVLEYLIKI